jgi:hypothetical protein
MELMAEKVLPAVNRAIGIPVQEPREVNIEMRDHG